MKNKIVVLGGSGFIGSEIVRVLKGENELSIVSRKWKNITKKAGVTFYPFEELPLAIKENAIIINLVGENILKKAWTPNRKKALETSRVDFTNKVVQIISEQQKDKTLINASAIGFYGNLRNFKSNALTENSLPNKDFAAHLCVAWEKSASALTKKLPGSRVVLLRIGVVIDPHQAILKNILRSYRFFLGGIMGNREDAFPWVALREIPFIIKEIISNKKINGAINLVNPELLSNDEFYKIIAKFLRRPILFKMPNFILQFFLRERSSLLLNIPFIKPQKLINVNYKFRYNNLLTLLKEKDKTPL